MEGGQGDGARLGSEEATSPWLHLYPPDETWAQSVQLPSIPVQAAPSFIFWKWLLEPGIPRAGGYSRDWHMIGTSSVKQLWKFAEKCETSELLRLFGQL